MDREKTTIKSIKQLMEGATSKKPYLIIISGQDSGKEFPLYTGKIIIGRNKNCDVFIHEQEVSRKHTEITFKNNKIKIVDLKSTNGTFVNGKKVTDALLNDGDIIHIGNSVLKVVYQYEVEKNYQQELYQSAVTDSLTGIFNKRYLLARMESEFIRTLRYKRNLSLILFDLDDFKKVNDTYGHMTGDIILKISAQLVKNSIRDADTLARFGGEEFAIILPETSLKEARQLANKILKSFRANRFAAENASIAVTASIGIASTTKKTRTWKDLIIEADKHLYKAKMNGKNQACC